MKVVNLISGPRNLSTALMYSFGNRADTQVVDEPFYAYYLSVSGVLHPGREEVLRTQSVDPNIVLRELKWIDQDLLFIKNMAHHIESLDWSLFLNFKNVILIRNPKQLIASFAQIIEHPDLRDIGLKYSYEMYNYFKDAGVTPIVIDSGELLLNPEKILKSLCGHLELSFSPDMLSWEPGPRKEDGVWAQYWYKNVHQSSGFKMQPTSSRELPAYLHPLYEEAVKYYDPLYSQAIKA